MSLYDRDYYRQRPTPPSGFGTEATGLSITTWIILINVAVFIFWNFAVGSLRESPLQETIPRLLFTWPHGVLKKFMVWQLLTGAFFHGDGWHLIFNMWVLYMLGRPLEEIIGRRDFLTFYLAAAVVGSICYVLWAFIGGDNVPAIGASGAVMGAVVLYAFHRPRQLIYIWGLFPLQVRWLAVLVVSMDLMMLLGRANTNIAHCAHLGGVLFAVIYHYADLRWSRIFRLFEKAPDRGPGPESWEVPPPPPTILPNEEEDALGDMDEVEMRVDTLLDKISQKGLTSLTEEERQFLRDASRRYGP